MPDTFISLRPPNLDFLHKIEHPHITLIYIQNRSPREVREALPEAVPYVERVLEVTGAGIWLGKVAERDPYWISYYTVESINPMHPLSELRDTLAEMLKTKEIHISRSYGFSPHITQRVTSTVTEARNQLHIPRKIYRFNIRDLFISSPGYYNNAIKVPFTR